MQRRNLQRGPDTQSETGQRTIRTGMSLAVFCLILVVAICNGAEIKSEISDENGEESNSTDNGMGSMQKNETEEIKGSVIVGLFDTLTGITKGVGGLFGQFEDGFENIRPENDSKFEELNITKNANETQTQTHGSSFIVGLFDTLKDLTKDVSKLVGGVEDELTNRRKDVVKLAERVQGEVQGLGSALKNWVNSLEDSERNITWSLNHTMPDGKVVHVANYTSWIKISSAEDHETEEVLVEDIPIID